MASSSTPARSWRFDVFLSFRGEDTRKTIVSYLHGELKRKGLIVFKDDRKLRTGDSISDELFKAIQESRFAVVVISQDYASSRWCLDELRMIMECKEKERLTVFPIFYEVDPSDVRYQKRTFEEAFEKHNAREMAEKVQKWREALRKVANLSGLDSRKWPDDDAIVREVVGDISRRLFSLLPGDFSDIIGMDAHLKALDPLLEMASGNKVRMIGIWGMGGIGKTTIAKYLYHKLSCQFLLHCFMENIKQISSKRGLVYLQEQFLSEILHQTDIRLASLEEGFSSIQVRLNHQNVLVILDDVDKLDQLHALARETNWFGPGSIIIITTRDKGLLKSHGVERVHEVKRLNNDDALRLFNRFAFRGTPPTYDFLQLSIRASRLVQGLPLALRVFGSSLCGRNIEQWESSIGNLGGDPCKDVMESLKVSYDGLSVREKVIFLCVACLFSEECVRHVAQLVDGKESDVSNSLNRLAEKSLVDISNGCVIVHDLIQEMAKEIVYEWSPTDPGGRRFLLDAQDIYDVLAYGTVTNVVEGVSLNMSDMTDFPADDWDFQRMQNLRFIKIYNTINCTEESLRSLATLNSLPRRLRLLDWRNCPLRTLPYTFHAGCLIDLRLPFSCLERLWKGTLSLRNLKRMDLSYSFKLKEIPDLSQATNLEELDLSQCFSLEKVPSPFSNLKKLTRLSMEGCRNLEFLPSTAELKSLEILNLGACPSLTCFPELSKSIVELYLYETRIEEVLDASIRNLTALKILNLSRCGELLVIPSMIGNLTALESLDLSDCKMLLQIPNTIEYLTSLRKLNMSGCEKLENIPNTIGNLTALQVLDLRFCKGLTNIPSTICNLSALETLTLSVCKTLSAIPPLSTFPYLRKLCLRNLNLLQVPDAIGYLQALQHLDLSENDFETLPASIDQLLLLEELALCNCKSLQSLPKLPSDLKYLYANDCSSLESISSIARHSLQILTLCNCFKLDYHAKLLIEHMMSKPIHMGEFKTWAFLCLQKEGSFFTNLSKEKSWTVDLPQSSEGRKPLGFFAEVVVAFETHHNISDFRVCCRWYGGAVQIGHTCSCPDNLPSHVSDSSTNSHGHLFFSCNFGEEISSGKVSFDFRLDCKVSYASNCCHIACCSVRLRFSEHDVRAGIMEDQTTGYPLGDTASSTGLASRSAEAPNLSFPALLEFGDLFGMDGLLEALRPLLCMGSNDKVHMIGICGVKGIGKTTVAWCLYVKLRHRFQFRCFMSNIRKIYSKHGREHLRLEFLDKISECYRQRSARINFSLKEARLRGQRVLAILDDVDELDQLDALARVTSQFGPGSLIIVTTTDKGLLISRNIKHVYEVKCLRDDTALELFNHFAMGRKHLSNHFMQLSITASRLLYGHPLALKVFGSYLRGKTIRQWEEAICSLQEDPSRTVMRALKVSYYGLDERAKYVFWRVAYLLNEVRYNPTNPIHVEDVIYDDGSGRLRFSSHELRRSLKRLAEKSLVDISEHGEVIMHDLIEEMAEEVKHQQPPPIIGRLT